MVASGLCWALSLVADHVLEARAAAAALAIAAIVLGVAIWVVANRRHTGLLPGPYVPGRAPSDRAAEVDSRDTYTEDDEPELVTVASSDDNTDTTPRS